MHFFETYDFFNFNLFNINFSAIFDKNFVHENWIKYAPTTPHSHETWELYFVKSGMVLMDCRHEKIAVGAGQSVVIPPETDHFIVSTEDDASFGSIRFCFSILENDKIGISINELLEKSALIPIGCEKEIIAEFDHLRHLYNDYSEQQDKKLWLYPKVTAQAMVFFASILETISKTEAPVSNSGFNTKKDISPMIIEFFMLYASDDSITINNLAENLNYSVSQTNRILNQKFGKSFRTLMRETRIKKAKYYLTRTDFSIQKISDILGFKEPKNFNKSFKETVGITPTVYRKNNTTRIL